MEHRKVVKGMIRKGMNCMFEGRVHWFIGDI